MIKGQLNSTEPGYLDLNGEIQVCSMMMVIEGYKTKSGSMIELGLKVMETFKDAPLVCIEESKAKKRLETTDE